MRIQEALGEHEKRVDELIKSGAKYLSALRAWKKACKTGHVLGRQKAARNAVELAPGLAQPTADVSQTWDFDVQEYLESGAWRDELRSVSREKFDLTVLEEDDRIVSPPLVIRAQPSLSRLQLGKRNWPTIHPEYTAKELKKLNEKSASEKESQQFLNALYDGCKRLNGEKADFRTKFRDLYNMYALAPGWTRENSLLSFGQQIYALDRSNVRVAREGRTYELEGPSGKPKAGEVITIISRESKPIDYYMIWFQ